VIGHLVIDVGLVESLAAKLREFGALICRLLAQCFAGVIIFRGDAKLFYQRERFLVHRFVISLHISCESEDILVLALFLGLFGSFNVELAGSVGDMGDLCVVRLVPSANTMPDVKNPTAASAAANLRDTIGTLLWTATAVLAIPWMLPRQKGSQIYS
jgi:hypothetical protein